MSGLSSPIEALRESIEEAAKRTTVDIPLPEHKAVVGRYRLLSVFGEGKEIGQRVRQQFSTEEDRLLHGMMDTLIAACEGLYIRLEGELQPIDPDGNGAARYDERLAASMGIESTSARETLMALFRGNDQAVLLHAKELMEWMSDTSRKPGEA